MIKQWEFRLNARSRGFHLVTSEILDQVDIRGIEHGILHLFIKHSSAGLTINENADPTVRSDMNKHFDKMVPENQPYYDHTLEGSDDMPAHIKSVLCGFDINIPITKGQLNLGTWQGIYLCEFRNRGGSRSIVATCIGYS